MLFYQVQLTLQLVYFVDCTLLSIIKIARQIAYQYLVFCKTAIYWNMNGYRAILFGDDDMRDAAQTSHNTQLNFIQGDQAYVTSKGFQNFATGRWDNLLYLNLSYYATPGDFRMRSKGCKILSKVALPKIEDINLQFTQIDANGVGHLSKTQWRTLQSLSVTFSKVEVGGLQHLVRANWKKLVALNFLMSQVTEPDVKKMLLSQYQRLILGFRNDHIGTSNNQLISIFAMKQYRLVLDNET